MTAQPDLRVRVYEPEDFDKIVELNRYGLAAAGVPLAEDVYAGDLDDITATYLTGRAAMLVGEIDTMIVAMGALREIDQTTCEITRMRVDPHHQGRGYGRAVLQALERQAQDHGYRRAVLLTGPDQHPAIDLYRSAGYIRIADERHGDLAGVRLAKVLGDVTD